MTAKEAKAELKRIAQLEGCTVKVVGDYAFRSRRRQHGKYKFVKLWGAPKGIPKISIFWL